VCLSQLFPLICPSPIDVYLLTKATKCLVNEELVEMLNKVIMASLKVLDLPQPLTGGGLGAGAEAEAEAKYTNSTLRSAVYVGVFVF
jgi:hypothetical protein